MSFGYLAVTGQYCHFLRENHFSLDDESRNVYFKFGMNIEGINTTPYSENDVAIINKAGVEFLQEVYRKNDGIFIFSYILLKIRESSIDFADKFFKILKQDLMSVLYVQEGSKLELNKPYIIEIDKNKRIRHIHRQIFEKWKIDLSGECIWN